MGCSASKRDVDPLDVAPETVQYITVQYLDADGDHNLLAKIDASPAEADEKQMLRGLVCAVRRQPTMADVVARVVDGDAAAAADALAAAPEEAARPPKFARRRCRRGQVDEAPSHTARPSRRTPS